MGILDRKKDAPTVKQVSIQLISPASGNEDLAKVNKELEVVSIQLISPASGNINRSYTVIANLMFPFN